MGFYPTHHADRVARVGSQIIYHLLSKVIFYSLGWIALLILPGKHKNHHDDKHDVNFVTYLDVGVATRSKTVAQSKTQR